VPSSFHASVQDVFDFIIVITFLALAVFSFLALPGLLAVRARRARPPQRVGVPIELPDRYAGLATRGSPVANVLDAIMAADKGFEVNHFMGGARSAYEMIVTAYAGGDQPTLANLLAPTVYEAFEAVIREREARGETAETRFLSIDATDIAAAEFHGKVVHVTLRFASHIVTTTRGRHGNVVDGNTDNATSVTDIWTFARNITSRDVNWKLVATETGA
jgi:predicted lipid-binding transport protein (Tim44 family)